MENKKITNFKYLFGLIGFPVSHSFSQTYFLEKFKNEGFNNCFYELFPLEKIDEFPFLIKKLPNLKGLNVTLPHKETVIPYLDSLDESAEGVGAVNTIKIENGELKGYNTDVFGFEKSLLRFMEKHQSVKIKNALVLGTGGASKAVQFVLKKMGISYYVVSRNVGKGDLVYEDLDVNIYLKTHLIVNTTPLGMAPKIDTFPNLKYNLLNSNHFLIDLVYNPEKTVFLTKGKKQGCSVLNGLPMLHYQAEKAWEIWNPKIGKKMRK